MAALAYNEISISDDGEASAYSAELVTRSLCDETNVVFLFSCFWKEPFSHTTDILVVTIKVMWNKL